jgi:branched-chain amino acid aminotransferase
MAPTAITPPQDFQQTADLTASAVAHKIAQTAPGLVNGSNGVETSLRSLDASKLKFTKTKTPMTVPQLGDPIIATSSQCTDHMITAQWTSTSGWDAPELRPYGNISLAPTASCLHYATGTSYSHAKIMFSSIGAEEPGSCFWSLGSYMPAPETALKLLGSL